MPFIIVSGLGRNSDKALDDLTGIIKQAVCNFREFELKPKDVTVEFPSHRITADYGRCAKVEIKCLFRKPERTPELRARLLYAVMEAVEAYSDEGALVEAFMDPPFDPEDADGNVLFRDNAR